MADAPDNTKAKPADAKAAAQHDAADVVNKDHHDGSQSAYAALKKDFDDHTKGMSADDKSTYWKTMNDSLSKAGVLPDLAVAWGQDSLSKGTYGDGDKLTVGDLNNINTMGSRSNDAQSQMDAAFAKSLKDQVATLSKNDTGDGYYDQKSIDTGAFKHAFDDQTKQLATNHQQEMNRDAMQPLLANNGALFKSLDTANDPGSKPDGQISHKDIDAWMKAADQARSINGSLPDKPGPDGKPVINEQNYQYVKGLRDGTLKDSDGKPVLQDLATSKSIGADIVGNANEHRHWSDWDGNKITMEDLGKEGGFGAKNGDVDGAIKGYSDQHAGDAGVPVPGGGDTKTDANNNQVKHESTPGGGDKYTMTSSDGKTATVTTKNVDDGNGGTYQQPTDVTTPDGGHYTRDDKTGKWTAAADSKDGGTGGKKDFSFDPSTDAIQYTGGDGKRYSETPDANTVQIPKTETDKHGADVTTDTSGRVTDIKYPAGTDGQRTTAHFDYDADGKLKDFNGDDGKVFTSADGGKTFTSPDGVTLKNAHVDKDGTVHFQNPDGEKVKVGTDGVPHEDKPGKHDKHHTDTPADQPAQPAASTPEATAAKAQMEKDSAQEQNKGPYDAAVKLLGPGATQADINALTIALKRSWQDSHGDSGHKNDHMTGLERGYQFLNDKNFQQIIDKVPALKAKYAAASQPATDPDEVMV